MRIGRDSLNIIQMTPFFHWIQYAFNKLSFLDYLNFNFAKYDLIFFTAFNISEKYRKRKRTSFTLIYFTALIPLHYLLLIEHEVFLTVFGFLSLHFSSLGLKKKQRSLYFIGSGFFLGLSFLSKLWLSGVFGIGLLFILIFSIIIDRYKISQYLIYTLLTLLSFLFASSLHLIVVAIFSKGELNLWIDNVYFGVFGGEDHRDKINTLTYFYQPYHYYFFVLIRDLFNYIPIIFGIAFYGRNTVFKNLKNYFSIGCLGVFVSLSSIESKF